MVEKDKNCKQKNLTFYILSLFFILIIVGHILVYVIGQYRCYEPSIFVLMRNIFLFFCIIMVYIILKISQYKGTWNFLIIIAILTGIGLIFQYRIGAEDNIGGRKGRQKQVQNIRAKNFNINEKILTNNGEEENENIEGNLFKKENQLDNFLRSIFSRFVAYNLIGFASIIFIFFVYSKRGVSAIKRHFWVWGLFTIILFVIFAVFSEEHRGGRFFFGMVPWEFFKFTIIVFLAGYFTKSEVNEGLIKPHKTYLKVINIPHWIWWLPLLAIFIILELIFLFLKDFGQLLIFGGLIIILLYASTNRMYYMIFSIIIVYLMTKFILIFGGEILPGSRFERFLIWENLWGWENYPSVQRWWDISYQMINSLFSLKEGGFAGTGLGLGFPTNTPEVVTDFTYIAIIEELGFIGGVTIILLYIAFLIEGLKVALMTNDSFSKLLTIGLSSFICIQAFVHIGGVINLIPMTGVTLPFISKGGFPFLVCVVSAGYLMRISHEANILEKE